MATTTPTTDEAILVAEMLQDGIELLEIERERVSDWEEGDVTAHLADLDRSIKARKDMLAKFVENSFSFGRA